MSPSIVLAGCCVAAIAILFLCWAAAAKRAYQFFNRKVKVGRVEIPIRSFLLTAVLESVVGGGIALGLALLFESFISVSPLFAAAAPFVVSIAVRCLIVMHRCGTSILRTLGISHAVRLQAFPSLRLVCIATRLRTMRANLGLAARTKSSEHDLDSRFIAVFELVSRCHVRLSL